MMLSQETMDALVSQYRGEVSAIQAYERALAKYSEQPEEMMLLRLQGEHRKAEKQLSEAIHRYGGVVPESAGAWGMFAAGLERLASLIGDEGPLRLLRRGEAIGADGYRRLLADPKLPAALEGELQVLLARSLDHHEALEMMIREVPESPNRPML